MVLEVQNLLHQGRGYFAQDHILFLNLSKHLLSCSVSVQAHPNFRQTSHKFPLKFTELSFD